MFGGRLQAWGETLPIENVVAEDHGTGITGDERFADEKGLSESIGGRLHRIVQGDSELAAITKLALKQFLLMWGRYHKDLPNAGQHEDGQGVINHGLVVDRKQLLRDRHGRRIKSGAGTTGEENAFHVCLAV